jgi:CO dehydrogenase/acetyl-CoA synthase alpha subunit
MDSVANPEVAQRFPDLHPALDARAAVVEANRCLNCFDAPCMGACPTHIDVPRFIRKIASGNVTGIGQDNPRRKCSGCKLRARLPRRSPLRGRLRAAWQAPEAD